MQDRNFKLEEQLDAVSRAQRAILIEALKAGLQRSMWIVEDQLRKFQVEQHQLSERPGL